MTEGSPPMSESDPHLPEGAPSAELLLPGEAASGPVSIATQVSAISRPSSAEGETMAALRNYLVNQHLRLRRRSLAICAATEGCGCTFTSVNLALATARAGINTLLIDANLRTPGLQDLLTPSRPVSGLSDYLMADDKRPPELIAHPQPNLSLLYAGTPTENSAELLAKQRFKALLDESTRSFDLTIVDCAPAANYGDARRVASILRHALVVVRQDVSFSADVKTLVQELQADGVNVVGTFLNIV